MFFFWTFLCHAVMAMGFDSSDRDGFRTDTEENPQALEKLAKKKGN